MYRKTPAQRFFWKIQRLCWPPKNGYELSEMQDEKMLQHFLQVHKKRVVVALIHRCITEVKENEGELEERMIEVANRYYDARDPLFQEIGDLHLVNPSSASSVTNTAEGAASTSYGVSTHHAADAQFRSQAEEIINQAAQPPGGASGTKLNNLSREPIFPLENPVDVDAAVSAWKSSKVDSSSSFSVWEKVFGDGKSTAGGSDNSEFKSLSDHSPRKAFAKRGSSSSARFSMPGISSHSGSVNKKFLANLKNIPDKETLNFINSFNYVSLGSASCVRIASLAVDAASPAFLDEHRVISLPTCLVFYQQKLIDRVVGIRPSELSTKVKFLLRREGMNIYGCEV